MRSDPYGERAHALAVEAGLDPDAKIDRPGQRPMPVWCTFRDAARKERVAAEAAAVATTLPPQVRQFQNAPLKVFGDHDEGTLAQMRNCVVIDVWPKSRTRGGQSMKTRSSLAPMRRLFGGISDEGLTFVVATKT